MSYDEQAEIKTQKLPVKLTQAEMEIRAQELATAEATLSGSEMALEHEVERTKAAKKSIENDIATHRAEVGRLARVVRERREDRDVIVTEAPDYDRGVIETVRVDTGEVIGTRGMTDLERQINIFERRAAKPKE